jgi:disulfide bond formation protein DsbB
MNDQFISYKNLRYFFLLVSILSLGVAFTAEYFFNIMPCQLCWYQRYIYMALFFGTIVIFNHPQRVFTLNFCLTTAALLVSIFHFGLEQHWWEVKAFCQNSALLSDLPSPDCSKVSWKLFDVSIVFWILMTQSFTLFF